MDTCYAVHILLDQLKHFLGVGSIRSRRLLSLELPDQLFLQHEAGIQQSFVIVHE